MSFVAQAPTPTQPADPENQIITNDPFFPNVDPQKVRGSYRLDGTVTDVRVYDAIVAAIITVNRALGDWKAKQQTAGYEKLQDVTATQIGGMSELEHLYLRAVGSTVKADLTEKYRDYDLTAIGDKMAAELTDSVAEQRRNAAWAISDICGRMRTTIDLI